MSVEIRELVIRAVSTSQSESSYSVPEEGVEPDLRDRAEIVQECVKQVMQILKRTKER